MADPAQSLGLPVSRMSETTDSRNRVFHVLMVEDEETLRTPVAKILQRHGFRVHEAADGGAAIAFYRAKAAEIDIVLLDMTLPSMCGSDVLSELQLIRSDVKVILTSARDRQSVMDCVIGQRPWGYIQKPYPPSELAELLRTACSGEERARAAGAL
jgi:DNA-binding response OmpR family regulator